MEAVKHSGQRALFFIQIFSTLGYSVLYGTLILYATRGLGLPDGRAAALTGGFIAFNYTLHLLGGYIGGRLMSLRSLFLVGMVLQVLGSITIAYPDLRTLLWGLSTFLTGAGLNMVCINCLLTQLFSPEDKRREAAFLWNYSGMNVGFFLGFALGGFFQLSERYTPLFLLSAAGSLVAFILAAFHWKLLKEEGTSYADATRPEKDKRMVAALAIVGALILALSWLLEHGEVARILILGIGATVAGVFGYLAWKEPSQEAASKLRAFLLLSVGTLVFFSLYQMAPMGLTLFYTRNVEQTLWGLQIAPQWLQNINTILIMLGGPLMAEANKRIRGRGIPIDIPFQFSLALGLIGLGFLLPAWGTFFADARGISSIGWIIGCYVFQSIGELFIAPIAYAMIGALIPKKLQSLAMGWWMMLTGVAALFSSYFSEIALRETVSISPLATNGIYAKTFFSLGLLAILFSFGFWAMRRLLRRLCQNH